MKLRQSRDLKILNDFRRVEVGEVDHEIDFRQLEKPPLATFDPSTVATCDSIYRHYIQPGEGSLIPRHRFHDLPIWVFLEYVVAHRGLLLDGSPDAFREELKPARMSLDTIGWDRPAHFAYRSSTEAIFGAVLDTKLLENLDCPRKNSFAMKESDSRSAKSRFYYGVDYRALSHGPWTTGAVYFYRASDFRDDFEFSPFLSADPIRPLAQVLVTPQDWPLIGKFSGVDVVALHLKTRETFSGYPWRRDEAIHPHLRNEEKADVMAFHLEANSDRPIDLPSLGKLIDASPVAAMRMFRAQKGLTPHKYHLGVRVGRAKELLKRGLPVAHLAAECGFSDQSHLTRQFKAEVGLTPGQYLRAQESSMPEG